MAYELGVPSRRGADPQPLHRPHVHRRAATAPTRRETKYTPLREVLEGKRVLLVEDSIVRQHDDAECCCIASASWAGRRRFTSASPARRSSRRASTASTCPRSMSCSRPNFLRGRRADARSAGRDGRRPGGRLAPLSAGRIDRPRDQPADRPALPGLHHRPIIQRRTARSSTRSPWKTSAKTTAPPHLRSAARADVRAMILRIRDSGLASMRHPVNADGVIPHRPTSL